MLKNVKGIKQTRWCGFGNTRWAFLALNMSIIKELCRNYTSLQDKEITILENLAREIPLIAELTGNDIFIDALTINNNDAIVLAWAKPKEKSLYKCSVVGKLAYASSEPAVYQTFKTGEVTRDLRGLSQEGVPIAQTVAPILDGQKVIGVLIMERDISKELEQEGQVEFLSHTAEQLSTTLMHLSTAESSFEEWLGNGIFVLNKQGKIIYANRIAANIYKTHCRQEALGNSFLNFSNNFSSLDNLLAKLKNPFELILGKKCYRLQGHPLVTKGYLKGCVVSIYDVTDLKEKEQELNAKSLIIQEINHRVKNNLQNIASLLRLQMRRTSSPTVREEFAASINRIISIALVHEVFAQQSWDTIDLLELSHRILNCLVSSVEIPKEQLETKIEGTPVNLSSRQAVSLALIINELITNGLKHGIAPRGGGALELSLSEKNGIVNLVVSDTGGRIDRQKEKSKKGLGLQIVQSLVSDHLGGVFKLESNNGLTKATVCFPKYIAEGE